MVLFLFDDANTAHAIIQRRWKKNNGNCTLYTSTSTIYGSSMFLVRPN
jgi:hypothetical protein